MTEHRTLRVSEEHHHERLDKFLVLYFPKESRATVQKWVERGQVTVNGKRVPKHFFLNVGDTVEVQPLKEKNNISSTAVVPLEILFEDDDILVVNKPNGLLVHSTENSVEPTLVDALQQHCPDITVVGDDPTRPGIVHRLDREASGVMVAAKTAEAFTNLKQQFQQRIVQKEYRAIVHGVPSREIDVLKFKMAHSKRKNGKMAARPEQEEGKEAWTEYRVLQTHHGRYALLVVVIKTGRTHQIRAHLAAIDHPVVGDTVYTSKRCTSSRTYPRLFLHAYRLSFRHPTTGQIMTFEAPLPTVFMDFFKPFMHITT